jgi:ATP-binding cassette, subfamily B, multidrug efflux pump
MRAASLLSCRFCPGMDMKAAHTRRFLKEYLHGTGRFYFWGILCLVTTVVVTTAIPQWIRRAVATLKTVPGGGELSPGARHDLMTTALVIIGLGLALATFRALSRILIFIPGRRVEEKVRQSCFDAIATAPPGSLDRFQTGDLISRGTSDANHTRVFLSMGILHSINSVLILCLCLYHMICIDARLTLICFLPAPLVQILVRRVSMVMMTWSRKVAAQLGKLTESVRETIGAHTLLTIYPVLEQMFARFMQSNTRYQHSQEKLVRIRAVLFTAVSNLFAVAQLLLLWFGGRLVLDPAAGLGVEDFVAMGMYLALVQEPLQAAGFLITLFQRNEASLERLYEVFDIARNSREEQAAKPHKESWALGCVAGNTDVVLSVRNLVHRYPLSGPENGSGEPFTLSIPELELRSGKAYGIFGQVGSGKSTLINILTGNIPVPRATCFYRGVDYRDIPLDILMGQFAISPQESRHFARSIRDNVDQVIANPAHPLQRDASSAEKVFENALQVSQLEPDIDLFPDGWQSLLGENGINLSGGQKQRLSILRALVKPHEILVLDDIISSVDHHTETRILHYLYARRQDHACVIFISHRISALMPCDEILVMEDGRIVARGTHAALLETHAGYRRSYEHQVLEQQIEEARHEN